MVSQMESVLVKKGRFGIPITDFRVTLFQLSGFDMCFGGLSVLGVKYITAIGRLLIQGFWVSAFQNYLNR